MKARFKVGDWVGYRNLGTVVESCFNDEAGSFRYYVLLGETRYSVPEESLGNRRLEIDPEKPLYLSWKVTNPILGGYTS